MNLFLSIRSSQLADIHGKRKRAPRKPDGPQINIQEIDYQISFDVDAFDSFIKSQGVWVTHWRAVPDPRGMASVGDNRDVLNIRPSDSDGFIYKEAGKMQVLFTTNSKHVQATDLGEMAFSTAYMTMPRFYDSTKNEIVLHTWDKLYLNDIEIKVTTSQYIEANKKGVDRLRFPAVKVTDIVDANGVSYEESIDFQISPEGNIVWLTQRRPGWNVETGKGTVYSIRYMYTPYFIVDRLLHEIRVSQVTKPGDFSLERFLERMPYQTQVVRENAFLDNKNPSEPGGVDPRRQHAPSVGGALGPQGYPSVSGVLGPKT